MHPTLAVTPEGVALGVIDAWMWARGPKDQPQVKESTRWVEGYEIVADWAEQTPDTRLVYVADREGDLRALMDAAVRRGTPADWLVRAKHNQPHHGGRPALGPCGPERIAVGGGIHPARRAGSPGSSRAANAVPGVGDVTRLQRRAGGNRDRDPSAGRAVRSRGMADRLDRGSPD